jgi:hypothetical protein
MEKVKIKNKEYLITKSDKPNKQLKVKVGGKWIYFGDPNMGEYPGTKRGNNYCRRSFGLGKKYNIIGDITSPNFWSREILWSCKGKKSLKDKYKKLRGL